MSPHAYWHLTVLVLVGCGSQTAPGPGDRPAPDPPPSEPGELPEGIVPSGYDGRFRTVTAVLESPEHGPQMCSYMEESYPPGCAGPDIEGWDWGEVESQSARATTRPPPRARTPKAAGSPSTRR